LLGETDGTGGIEPKRRSLCLVRPSRGGPPPPLEQTVNHLSIRGQRSSCVDLAREEIELEERQGGTQAGHLSAKVLLGDGHGFKGLERFAGARVVDVAKDHIGMHVRGAKSHGVAMTEGPAFGLRTGMPPKEEPRSRSAGTGLGKANGRVEDPGAEWRRADPDLLGDLLGHPPLCRRGLSPTATTSMQLLPIASGEKKRSTSSSKNVSPVAPKRCAYDARYTLPATVPAQSCAAR